MKENTKVFRFDIITLFPEFFLGLRTLGLIGKAVNSGTLHIEPHDLRNYGLGNYRQVDDRAYGGGVGIILRPEPLVAAIEDVKKDTDTRVILLSPQGRLWTQALARQYAQNESRLILVCGRYEGVDERVTSHFTDDEVSIGEFVTMGGEVAAWAVIESISRLIPGVIGNPESLAEESFEKGMLDYPQYTRPMNFRGYCVPKILRSGHHELIERWRRFQALKKTALNRPDLLLRVFLTEPGAPVAWIEMFQDWILWLEKQYNKLYSKNYSEDKNAQWIAKVDERENTN